MFYRTSAVEYLFVALPGVSLSMFQLDFTSLIANARRKLNSRINGVEINLPFLTFCIAPTDLERAVSREIIIRSRDKRVLSSKECCDNCIDNSVNSLLELRSLLVDQQVRVATSTDGPVDSSLYLIIEFTVDAIRQFLTFHENLSANPGENQLPTISSEFRRERDVRETYFAVLETLRAHLHRCLHQINIIAKVELPVVPGNLQYNPEWELQNYVAPQA